MKAIIKTTTHISESDLKEVKELFPEVSFTIERVQVTPHPTWNPYFKLIEIDWSWFRTLFDRSGHNIHCFVTTAEALKAASITKYLGLYSLDTDNIHEFWFGLPSSLHRKAKANGYRSNFAWMFTHELLHGLEREHGKKDRVHVMEEQGRLKELIQEYTSAGNKIVLQKKIISLGAQVVELLRKLIVARYTRPLPQHWDLVTQPYLNKNTSLYPQSGVHVGTDFAAPLGTPILAPTAGRITRSSYSPTLGNWVEFEFGDRYLVALHLANKQAPRNVAQGEPIGFVGDTGAIHGVHAHLEGWVVPMERSLLTSPEAVTQYTFDITEYIR